jgi:hypothetical protein
MEGAAVRVEGESDGAVERVGASVGVALEGDTLGDVLGLKLVGVEEGA